MNLYNLPVYFRGDRNYIQGSLILSRVCTDLVEKGAISPLDDVVMTSAKFSEISNSGIAYSNTKDKHSIGSVSFVAGDQKILVYIYKSDNIPNRVEEKPSLITNSRFKAPLDGTVWFKSAGSFDQIIDAIVQATKLAHKRIADDLYDIWFTGLGKTKFPIFPFTDISQDIVGVLEVKPLLSRQNENVFQTLSRVTLSLGENEPFGFNVSYAYKKKGQSL